MRDRIVNKYQFPPLVEIRFLSWKKELVPFFSRRYAFMKYASNVGCIFPSAHFVGRFFPI